MGAWRLMRVCKAARVGAKEWLRTSGANNDEDVLRLVRHACPELWLADADVRTWEGVTFGEGEHGTAERVVKIV
jgi:hypothetical protein